MKKTKIIFAGLLVAGLVISCQKIEKYDNIVLLLDKDWHLTSITNNGLEVADTCQLDNTMLFTESGEITHDFGILNCEDDFLPQKWKFVREYSQIKLKMKLDGGMAVKKQEIIELSENRLVLKDIWANDSQEMPELYFYSTE